MKYHIKGKGRGDFANGKTGSGNIPSIVYASFITVIAFIAACYELLLLTIISVANYL